MGLMRILVRTPYPQAIALGLLALMTACAAPIPVERNPGFEIPVYGADDPRAATVGFVNKASRARRRIGDAEYTLLAFAVDDAVTLAVMIEGAFVGTAHLTVGPHRMALDFPREREESVVAVVGDAEVEKGRARVFDAARWVELDLPRSWWTDGAVPASVSFEPQVGTGVVLPRPGEAFQTMLVPAPRADRARLDRGRSE